MPKTDSNPIFSQEIDVVIEKQNEWSKELLETFFIERFKALFPQYDSPQYHICIIGILQKNSLKASVGAFLKNEKAR